MNTLGVFQTIYGANAEMTLNKALLISVVGFLIVFIMLSILALFVKGMGKVFDLIGAKKKPATTQTDATVTTPLGTPLPDGVSVGEVKLHNVTDEEAACIMAIVSHKTGIPLNRLQFNSISEKEEKKQ